MQPDYFGGQLVNGAAILDGKSLTHPADNAIKFILRLQQYLFKRISLEQKRNVVLVLTLNTSANIPFGAN